MQCIGLTLGSGGARGLCLAGYLKVLDELNIRPHIISGTSIGAIIGAAYASGMSGVEIEKIIKNFNLKDLTGLFDIAFFNESSLLKGNAVMEFLDRTIPANIFEELQIPMKIVATDFWNREEVIFDSGDLIAAVRASISLPAVFEPVRYNNQVLIDGGATNPLPYDIIRDQCDFLIAIDVSGIRVPFKKYPIPNMFQSSLSTFEIAQESIIVNKEKICKPDLLISPPLENIELLDFHRIKTILQSAEKDVQQFKMILPQTLQKFQKRNWLNGWGFIKQEKCSQKQDF